MLKAIVKLLGAASDGQITNLSRQVASASFDNVTSLVAEQIEGMSFSEARGYVRARAAVTVRKQARQVISQAGSDMTLVEEVARLATEQLLPQVLRQVGVGVPKAAPQIRLAA